MCKVTGICGEVEMKLYSGAQVPVHEEDPE